MQRLSEPLTTLAHSRRFATLVLALVLAVVFASGGQAQAQAQDSLLNDQALSSAAEMQQQGHPWQAEALLRRLAETGDVLAMERLALLHWYGQRLYPGQPWDRALARHWFARAAAQGSEIGRFMLAVADRPSAP